MKVNIIVSECEKGWILYKIANKLKERLNYIDINGKDKDYDITYYSSLVWG